MVSVPAAPGVVIGGVPGSGQGGLTPLRKPQGLSAVGGPPWQLLVGVLGQPVSAAPSPRAGVWSQKAAWEEAQKLTAVAECGSPPTRQREARRPPWKGFSP